MSRSLWDSEQKEGPSFIEQFAGAGSGVTAFLYHMPQCLPKSRFFHLNSNEKFETRNEWLLAPQRPRSTSIKINMQLMVFISS